MPMSKTSAAEEHVEGSNTWPDLAIGLYERLTGQDAEIKYEFDEMEVQVPNKVGDDAEHAAWRLDGSITITTRERD